MVPSEVSPATNSFPSQYTFEPGKSWSGLLRGVPPAHVQPHFTQERLGYNHVDAVDARQVYSGDTLQFAAEIEAWSILCWLCFLLPPRFCFWRLGRNGIGKTGQVLLQVLLLYLS